MIAETLQILCLYCIQLCYIFHFSLMCFVNNIGIIIIVLASSEVLKCYGLIIHFCVVLFTVLK